MLQAAVIGFAVMVFMLACGLAWCVVAIHRLRMAVKHIGFNKRADDFLHALAERKGGIG